MVVLVGSFCCLWEARTNVALWHRATSVLATEEGSLTSDCGETV
jgi:hypothetical protein